jgi:uncharacterized membrane protein
MAGGGEMSDAFGRRRLLRATAGSVLAGTAVGGVSARTANSQQVGTVVGIVTDLPGAPVEGAAVALLDGETEVAATQTDENGQYGVAAEPGTYELTVEKAGFSPFSDEVTIEEEGQQVTVNVTLDPPDPGAVIGTVVDNSGNRIEGAGVTLLDGSTEVAATITDGDGQYSLAAAAGSYGLEVRQAGFEPVIDEVTIESGAATVLNVALPAGPPPLPGSGSPPADLDGDGRFEDIDGDGTFDIFDVQALFVHLDSTAVQSNPAAFNFNGDDDPTGVTIFDVQALFERLGEQD